MSNSLVLPTKKIIAPEDVERVASDLKMQGKTIATLNGSFDLLHAGHLTIIHEAKEQADILFMALNSDSSIQSYKSPSRPIIPLRYRLEMIAALEAVDFVTWFDELDPIAFLLKVKPHVHVNGSEYGENCIEADTVKQNGGVLHIVSLKDGLSTTKIIQKIQSLCD